MKPSRVSRVVQLLTTLSKAGGAKGYTADELSRMLGVSRRTMFRDLKEIQEIGIQPLSLSSRRGYALPPEQFLPPVNLNLQEALGLLLLVHKMRSQIQMPFKHSAIMAAMKIESCLPPKVRHYCENALARISAKPGAQAPAPPGLDNIFTLLQSAAAQRKKVRIDYDSLVDGKAIYCELSPYHLLYNQRAWYVVGLSSVHKAVRTFKLNRIRNAEMSDKPFSNDGLPEFDLAEYIGCAWSMIPEGKIYNVRLRFAPKVANNVAEVQWHKTQKVARNPDGSATVDFRVDGLSEITWWILGYGDQVEVLSPAELRKTIADIAHRMVEISNTGTR